MGSSLDGLRERETVVGHQCGDTANRPYVSVGSTGLVAHVAIATEGAHRPGLSSPVKQRGYSYALVLSFDDAAAQDAYQVHPVHDRFREQCGGSWKKIVIYDAVSA